MEQSLVLIKPDAVNRGLVGEIIRRFENRTLKLKAIKIVRPSRDIIERHYADHKGKPFYDSVVNFMSSGTVVAMVLEGDNAIPVIRQMMGALNPLSAASGTIRGDYTLSNQENLVHGSDSPESAEKEIGIWFSSEEILP